MENEPEIDQLIQLSHFKGYIILKKHIFLRIRLLTIHTWVFPKLGMAMHLCNLSTRETEAGDHQQFKASEFKASLGKLLRSCLKMKT